MDGVDLPRILKTSALGAGLGALAGIGLVLVKPKKSHPEQEAVLHPMAKEQAAQLRESESQQCINLKHAPDAEEALQRMSDYRTLDPEAYRALRLNMDRIVGIYLLVHGPEPVHVNYEIKAFRYRANIQDALRRILNRYHDGKPSKQLGDDAEHLLKCTDNYLYNLSQQMKEKFAKRQVRVQ